MARNLSQYGVKKVKPYNVKSWHFKYEYYTGNYRGKMVFIKYNGHARLITHEYNNIIFLRNESRFLANHLPEVYMLKQCRNGAYLVEDYLDLSPISKITINSEEYAEVFVQLETIIKEFHRIGFMHLDINSGNVFLTETRKVFLIDLGFSNICDKDMDIFYSKHFRRLIMNNLNLETRLDIAVIDDAYSMLVVEKELEPDLISNHNEYWKRMVMLSNNVVFDGRKYI